jgi:chorismate mutase
MAQPEKTISSNNTEWKKSMEESRAKIDVIDDQIVTLLKQRLEHVKTIGKLKHTHSGEQFVIRPGREATMVRRIFNLFQDSDFHPIAAASMWRQIIAASANTESPLKISVYSPAEHSPQYWITREYFGSFCPITRQPSARRVVGDVMDGKANIGILPLPQSSEQDPWWSALASQSKDIPRIFAYIPFINLSIQERDRFGALAIARVEPENTGKDITYLLLKTDMEISQSRLNSIFSKLTMKANWLSIQSPTPDQRHHLIELAGFFNDDCESIKQFIAEAGSSILGSIFLGSYAEPIITKEPHAKISNASRE